MKRSSPSTVTGVRDRGACQDVRYSLTSVSRSISPSRTSRRTASADTCLLMEPAGNSVRSVSGSPSALSSPYERTSAISPSRITATPTPGTRCRAISSSGEGSSGTMAAWAGDDGRGLAGRTGVTAAASSPSVSLSYKVRSDTVSPALRAAVISGSTMIESPPRAKKLSPVPTLGTPRASAQIAASVFSAAVRGATYGAPVG